MNDPENHGASWSAFWTFIGTVAVMFLVQFFRYLTRRANVEAVEGRAVLDAGWKSLFDSQNKSHATALSTLEKRIAFLDEEHRNCVEGQRVLREKQDALGAQIEVLRAAQAKAETVLIVTDHRGVVLTASESAVPFFKRAMTDLVGHNCRALMDGSSWIRHAAAFEGGERRSPPRLTTGKAVDSTGSVFDVAVDTRRSFINADGNWIYVAEISRVRT
jgi:hypothetical protein